MTTDQLIAEGRRLQRPTRLLMPVGAGDVAAIWYGQDQRDGVEENYRRWISVNAKFVPGCSVSGWLTVFKNQDSLSGRIELSPTIPKTGGVWLHAVEISLLPPIEAVFVYGSPAVEQWLTAKNWQRTTPYNRNFRDRAVVEGYEVIQHQEYSLYLDGAYATLGGWHSSWPDGDWYELLDAKLLVHTYMDAEPWVEAWQLPSGAFEVIQRIT